MAKDVRREAITLLFPELEEHLPQYIDNLEFSPPAAARLKIVTELLSTVERVKQLADDLDEDQEHGFSIRPAKAAYRIRKALRNES